jgi:uncharacterized RDD family membrane protein YckC
MATNKTILTGQYVCIEQMPAKLSLRFFAFFIDLLIQFSYLLVWSFLDDYLIIHMTKSEMILFVALPILLYQPVCESLSGGQTLGKYLMKTRVVRVDGSSPSVGDILLRWLILVVDIIFFGAVAAFSMLVTSRRQRLGDLAAGTMVIRLNTYDKIRVSLEEFRFVQDNYEPTYKEALNLTENDANRISRTLADRSTSRRHRIEQLSREVRKQLLMDDRSPVNHEAFLNTLLCDYRYYDLHSV